MNLKKLALWKAKSRKHHSPPDPVSAFYLKLLFAFFGKLNAAIKVIFDFRRNMAFSTDWGPLSFLSLPCSLQHIIRCAGA